jgi:predicted RNase H-like HicB family nuclease
MDLRITDNNTIHLPILIEQDEDNCFIVSCPVFKGCHSFGKTVDEALENIKEVIEMCMEEEKGNSNTPTNRFIGFREMQVSYKSTAV